MTDTATELLRSITGPEIHTVSGSLPRWHKWKFDEGFVVTNDPTNKQLILKATTENIDWSKHKANYDVDLNNYAIINLTVSGSDPSSAVNVEYVSSAFDDWSSGSLATLLSASNSETYTSGTQYTNEQINNLQVAEEARIFTKNFTPAYTPVSGCSLVQSWATYGAIATKVGDFVTFTDSIQYDSEATGNNSFYLDIDDMIPNSRIEENYGHASVFNPETNVMANGFSRFIYNYDVSGSDKKVLFINVDSPVSGSTLKVAYSITLYCGSNMVFP